jgi:cytochrome c oxidase subunit 3
MQVGTIEATLDESEPEQRKRSCSAGGPSPGDGGRRGGGGDNGDGNGSNSGGDYKRSNSEPDSINRDKSRVIAWFLLLVVLMTFGGLIGAYVVIATNGAIEWAPFSLPIQVWISTVIILASSATYEFFRRAVEDGDLLRSRRFLVATTVLGGIFIASQLIAWLELVNRGLYMRGNPYAGFFYILTAAHAIHVLGGMIALGAIMRRSWYPAVNNTEEVYRINVARAVGWYWHLMGGLWIVLFLLLGFWK